MNAYANENLRMPAHYVDMSEKEMEYDGGWNWFKSVVKAVVCGAIAVAGVGISSAIAVGSGGMASPLSAYIVAFGIGVAGSLAVDFIDSVWAD